MTSYKIITLQNVDDENFVFDYNKSEGNPPYLMPAGEVVRYPEFVARHALKHLIDKILNKRGERTNNQVLREELANQIIIGEEKSLQQAEPTVDEKLRAEIDELNQPSPLDKILAKRKEEKTYKKKVKKAEKEQLEVDERFEGLDKVEEPKVEEKPKEPPKVVKDIKPKPTRKELFTYAEKDMNMVLDKKTKSKLTKMTIDEVIKELDYPVED